MGRPRNKSKFKIIDRKDRAYYYLEYFSETEGKSVQRSSGYSKSDYTREMVQRIVDSETGTKRTAQYSIDWLEEYINNELRVVEGLTERTIESYKYGFEALRNIYGGNYSIMKIDRSAVSEIKKYLIKRGNRPETINSRLSKIRAAFDRAYANGILEKNPFYRFKLMNVHNDKQKYFTYTEAKRLLNILNTHPNRKLAHLIRISMYTGLRREEVLTIRREDVSLSELFFRHVNCKTRDRIKEYKPMPEEVVKDFKWFMNTNKVNPMPFKVYTGNGYTQMVRKLLREHKFNHDLHLHSFRHTAATLAIENGQDIHEVQRCLGHRERRTTEQNYLHDTAQKPLRLGLDNE